jgi:hypothetical protein
MHVTCIKREVYCALAATDILRQEQNRRETNNNEACPFSHRMPAHTIEAMHACGVTLARPVYGSSTCTSLIETTGTIVYCVHISSMGDMLLGPIDMKLVLRTAEACLRHAHHRNH